MPTFDLKIIDSIRGRQAFYQLTIDDNPDLEGIPKIGYFTNEIN
jgi:hypothetical protein